MFAFSLILHITMGLNILKFFSVLSIFLFVASAYHLAERAVVTCDHCAPFMYWLYSNVHVCYFNCLDL
ncbi:hypothetical protein GLOIN_2v1656412 [Rhizophagus irregularis DAOM 181602=DAOM 197198]|nr:hypothetical protein GLOIN_2v1656412 [Rhizophagus irregularis DAOM 181602=DAOM 197198]